MKDAASNDFDPISYRELFFQLTACVNPRRTAWTEVNHKEIILICKNAFQFPSQALQLGLGHPATEYRIL